MDQMIQQIIDYSAKYKTYSDDDIKNIAEYLVGKNTFDRVIPILAQPKETYYSNKYKHVQEIAEGVIADPSLYIRLGRHLRLIEYMNGGMYSRLILDFMYQGKEEMSLSDIFIKGGLGEEELIAFACDNGGNQRIHLKEILETIYKTDPEAIFSFLSNKDLKTYQRFPVSAFIFGKTGFRQTKSSPQSIFSKIVNAFKSNMDMSGIESQFDSDIAASIMFNIKLSHSDRLEKYIESLSKEEQTYFEKVKSYNKIDTASKDEMSNITSTLFKSFIFSDYKIEIFNKRMALLCSICYNCFFNSLINHFTKVTDFYKNGDYLRDINENNKPSAEVAEKNDQNTLETFKALTDVCNNTKIDFAYLVAWIVSKFIYRPTAGHFVREDYFKKFAAPHLEKARETARPQVKLYIDFINGKISGDKKYVEEAETALTDGLREYIMDVKAKNNDASDLDNFYKKVKNTINFLSGKKLDEDIVGIPRLDEIFERKNTYYYSVNSPDYNFDMAIVLLHAQSEMYGRYLKFISSGGYIHRVKLQINLLSNLFNYAQEKIIDIMEKHVDVVSTVAKIAESSADYYNNTKKFDKAFIEAMIKKDPSVAVKAMETANADGRLYLFDLLYDTAPDYDPDFLISCLGDSSKKVSQHAFAFLYPKKELIEKVRPMLNAKKKAIRESAEKLMSAYEGASNSGGGSGEGETSGEADIISYCTRTFPKGGMRSLVWAIPGDLPTVRLKDSDSPANEIVLQCYLYQYLTSVAIEIPPSANKIREVLNQDDLRKVSEQVFAQWLNDGAPAKRKSAVLFFGVHANDANVLTLKKQIEDWAEASRGAIAAEAVKAMVLGGSDLALMTVDSMSRKFKNKQVMKSAKEAFALAAKALDVSVEALGDRIIPNLGFDERGEKYIDYGSRKFKAILDVNMNIILEDENGKEIKSLPKPGAKDDEKLAEAAKTDFAALKKTLKTVVSTQTSRLEAALSSRRKWTAESWKNLFVKNPIMRNFAVGLIWGVYHNDKSVDKLTDTFRYMDDGSFNTVDEETFDFDAATANKDSSIALPHPIDMSEFDKDKELIKKWKQQLEDYDITQPFSQLDRPVYKLEQGEEKQTFLTRFGGKKMLGITLLNKLQKLEWNKGSVQDGGSFSTMYKENEDAGIGVQLYFTYMYISPDPTEVTTVGEAAFYKAGGISRGSYVYDDVTLETVIPLKEVPERILSETIYELTTATESSQEKDEDWRSKDKGLVYELKSKKK